MIPLAVFFALMVVISVWDAKFRHISNMIVLPATFIAAVCLNTGLSVGVTFLIGIWIYSKNKLAGGDIKLFIMCSAFLGWAGLVIYPLTILGIKLYRKIRDNYVPLAVAPFMTAASIAIVIADKCIRQFCR